LSAVVFRNLLIALLVVSPLAALGDDSAVEAGRKALTDSASLPWYDAASDGLRDLQAKKRADDDSETRKTGWEFEVQKTQSRPVNWRMPSMWEGVQYLAIGLFVLVILGVGYLLLRYYLKLEPETATGEQLASESPTANVERLEQLPFDLARPQGNLLSEARRLYEQGRYSEAVVYLFSYELVTLDRHQWIHLTKGKTNRQYLREAGKSPQVRGLLERTMVAFEDVFFGHHDLDRERFEACWQGLDEFHRTLEQGAAA
jgi:hypothetical protein